MSVAVVELVAGTVVPADQRERLCREPGLGAVVVGDATAVVVHERLLAWVPRESIADPRAWLDRLALRLQDKGYRVEDVSGSPYVVEVPSTSLPQRLKGAARRALRTPLRARVRETRRRWRRWRFLGRLRWEAWLAGTDLTADVARDFEVEPGVRFQMRSGPVVLRIGPRCRMSSGVLLRLGGELVLGPNCELRHDLVLNVKGRLHFEGRNVLGVGVMVHADLPLTFEWGAMVAEYATVLDSDHELDGSLVNMFDQGVLARPVRIGACSFLGSKSTVLPGVSVGRRAVVGAGSVVTKDVPEACLVTGVPARPLRQLGAEA